MIEETLRWAGVEKVDKVGRAQRLGRAVRGHSRPGAGGAAAAPQPAGQPHSRGSLPAPLWLPCRGQPLITLAMRWQTGKQSWWMCH